MRAMSERPSERPSACFVILGFSKPLCSASLFLPGIQDQSEFPGRDELDFGCCTPKIIWSLLVPSAFLCLQGGAVPRTRAEPTVTLNSLKVGHECPANRLFVLMLIPLIPRLPGIVNIENACSLTLNLSRDLGRLPSCSFRNDLSHRIRFPKSREVDRYQKMPIGRDFLCKNHLSNILLRSNLSASLKLNFFPSLEPN